MILKTNMKNLKLFLVALLAVVSVSSCMKTETNDFDYEANQRRIDSTLKAQAPRIEAYAKEHFGPNVDSAYGIWYEVLPSTVDSTFEYVSAGNGWVPVTANLKYKGQLMDGKVFEEKTTPTQMTINRLITSWMVMFYPKATTGYSGILPHGLLKGNKVRFIAPSPLCYDNQAQENIPADSPLIFTIEVTDIRNAN